METFRQEVISYVQTKIAQIVAMLTTGTGISTAIGYIPEVIGITISIVGFVATIHLWKKQSRNLDKIDKKLDLEIKLLEKQNG